MEVVLVNFVALLDCVPCARVASFVGGNTRGHFDCIEDGIVYGARKVDISGQLHNTVEEDAPGDPFDDLIV